MHNSATLIKITTLKQQKTPNNLMNRIYLALLIILTPFNGFSQAVQKSAQFEIGMGAGMYSSDYIFDGYTPRLLGSGKKQYINHQYSGTYFINARYYFSERVSLNITLAYENESGDWLADYNYDHFGYSTMVIGTFTRQAYLLSPEISIYYTTKKHYRLYGTFGMGLNYRKEYDYYNQQVLTYGLPGYVSTPGDYSQGYNGKIQGNGYLSPLGISAGGKLSWFAELGIGYKGIFNTGISLKL
jgi:hypothetical protein